MLIARRRRGFTLIELMIGVALFAIVLMLAMPSFSVMLQNAKLRATAESILAGLQETRTEALKRNQTVEFMLMADDPDPANVLVYTVNTTGPGWAVRVLDTAGVATDFVEGRSGLEGSSQADPAALYARISVANLPATNTIRFDGLGRTNVGVVNSTFDVKPAAAGECKADGGTRRCLQIVITPGGRVRMCDPDPAITDANDTRRC